MSKFRVRLFRLEGGERLPFLLAEDGIPLFRPMQWLISMRRVTNVSSATLQANLFSLKLLYAWAATRGLDLETRILTGHYLDADELTSLVDASKERLQDLVEEPSLSKIKPLRVANRESVRMKPGEKGKEVITRTSGNRLRTITDFLIWLSQEGMRSVEEGAVALLVGKRDAMITTLRAKFPQNSGRSVVGLREGPPQEVIDKLLEVLELDSPENPWKDLGLRTRNRLYIHLLFGLGLRRGEVLSIKNENINYMKNNVILIARNADDPLDPRTQQPLVKTRDHMSIMSDELAGMIHQYVTYIRNKFPGARRHSSLFISHNDGVPISLSGANKIFIDIRKRVKGLPADLTAHSLRHGWNEAFSRMVDRQKIDPAREEQMRNEQMGWVPGSGTSATYTRRKTREDAERFSIAHQEDMMQRMKK